MTLAEFILARVADDEAAAREEYPWAMDGARWKHYPQDAYDEIQSRTLACVKRTLAECESKRRIVEYAQMLAEQGNQGGDVAGYHATGMGIAIKFLALPFADHPDYDPSWRP